MLVGYARISTTDQNRDLQKDAPRKIGRQAPRSRHTPLGDLSTLARGWIKPTSLHVESFAKVSTPTAIQQKALGLPQA